MEEKRLQLLELKRQQLEARKQQDPALEAMINETKEKVAAYSAKVEANRPKPNAAELAKDAGLVRLGIKKRVDDREVVARI
jgi:anti-sigma-K factor RskA